MGGEQQHHRRMHGMRTCALQRGHCFRPCFRPSLRSSAPVVSGPKHQIFLASSLSQPNSSDRILERTCVQGTAGSVVQVK